MWRLGREQISLIICDYCNNHYYDTKYYIFTYNGITKIKCINCYQNDN